MLSCLLILYCDNPIKRYAVHRRVAWLQADVKAHPENTKSIDKLLNIATGDYRFGATVATVALGDVGCYSFEVRKKLASLLNSPNLYVQREAARSLGRCGPASADVMEEIEEYVEGELSGRDSVAFAVQALGNIGFPARRCIPLLRSKIGQSRMLDVRIEEALEKLEACDTMATE